MAMYMTNTYMMFEFYSSFCIRHVFFDRVLTQISTISYEVHVPAIRVVPLPVC